MNWDYIAGFVDGEGTVGLYIQEVKGFHAKTEIAISQAGEDGLSLIEMIREFVGCGNISSRIRPQKTVHRNIHRLRWCGEDLDRILPKLVKRCFLKHGQLTLMMAARALLNSKKRPADQYTSAQRRQLRSLAEHIKEMKHAE